MKTISLFLISCTTALSVLAQNSTVTITVRGNNNEQVLVDGKSYVVSNDYNTNSNTPITINDLQPGQHTLRVTRTDDIDNNTTTFNLRSGYDLQIIVTANGSVQLRETRIRGNNTNNTNSYKTPMSDINFNTLYNSVRNQWRSTAKMDLVSDAFENNSNYFITTQAKQLIHLVRSESNRLILAKASYRSITDPENFYQLNDLLNSQASRNDLSAYVESYTASNTNTSMAMSTTDFNTIYRMAQRQSTTNSKVSYIYNTFANTNNYFTVSQARQLIQLVPDESNRLHLAKISYRSIVDRANFSRMHTLLNSQTSRNELTTFVNTYDDSKPVNVKMAMKEADFNTLYRDVQNRFGIGAKMSALNNIFGNNTNYFTVMQAKQLIQLVSAENNRLELAKAAYDNIVDQTNFSQMTDVLSTQSSRNELDVYVRNYQGGLDNTRIAMSDASFNTLYNDVRNRFGLGAKMSALTDIFANESNHFTVAQAKQLIQLVSAESNRLELAKSAYGNITDPENFNLMYDLLSSQTSKSELASYVNTYSYNR